MPAFVSTVLDQSSSTTRSATTGVERRDSTSASALSAAAVHLLKSVACAVVVSLAASLILTQQTQQDASSHKRTVRAMAIRRHARNSGLDTVGGLDDAKSTLRRCVLLPLRHAKIFYELPLALRPPRGVLLHGPPGTGKTMLARALAADSGVPLLMLHSAALESKWWGESSKLLSAAFDVARTELAPCIVFFDEIDGLGRARSESDQSCVYSFKCELLRNMDGEGAVVVIACTNCVHSLDVALRRRFTKVVHIGKPTCAERHDILRKLGVDASDRTLLRVARASEGLTGADLATLAAEASSHRMSAKTEEAIEAHLRRARTAAEFVRTLGPLKWSHWAAALRPRGLVVAGGGALA
jgi:transitional endoplasmic reticulum ATPase